MPHHRTVSPRLSTRRRPTRGLSTLWLAAAAAVLPVETEAQVNLAALQDEAVEWLQEYIRINTINPPGNETAGAEFFAAIFDAEGIEYEMAESAPGRGNIWARLEGGDEPGIVLLHHIDVVPADERYWTTDPLSGELRDGYIYGRGTLDTKTSGILHLAAFLALHRSETPLERDVIFMATADEEAGGFFGAGWLVENRPELFENVGFLLNEGGGGSEVDGVVNFGLEVTQKVPYWLRLTATGEPGHGSRPLVSYASVELIAALERFRLHEFEARIIPPVQVHFEGIADRHPEPWNTRFANMATAIQDPVVLRELQEYAPGLHALTRNTCSITRFEGSNKINVVSPEVAAEIDCRLLPDQDPDAWLAEVRDVLGPEIEVEVLMGFTPAISSTDTELFRVAREVTLEEFPDAGFVPQVVGGFTDSHFFRDLGITSYGYTATATPLEDAGGVHGNDERVTELNVRRGVKLTLQILERFAATRPVM
ncbi:MAG: M20/M25/M40 family metallo-hydrolase [Gemmatimonadetes bacterium]|nr:M20/M25/M40 family metallo-hydrolase [Gemmatimonadota bacterium]NNM33390.1 M20/M25/M40 family metallo-hydrolase [Gemmatimonadota bacterium]